MTMLDNLCSVEYEVVKPGSMVTKLSSTWFVTHSWKTSNQKVVSNKYAHSDRTIMEYECETLNSKVLWSWGLFLLLLYLVLKHLAISIGWERPSLVILLFFHISKNRKIALLLPETIIGHFIILWEFRFDIYRYRWIELYFGSGNNHFL